MWTEALSLLEQADRLHRQFLRAAGAEQPHAWEPPVDVIETGDEVRVQIALPGVSTDAISVAVEDRKSTRLNSSHVRISYAVFCLKKKKYNRSECARITTSC